MRKENKSSPLTSRFAPKRGSLISVTADLSSTSNLAIVVSNDVQNDVSDFLTVVPLQRRVSRLRAPFAVDLGRKDGFRELHTVRCDWVTRLPRSQVESIERAALSKRITLQIEAALCVALGLKTEQWDQLDTRPVDKSSKTGSSS
ncbi:MAG: type II toxin-antitoxin system PemK/MazF family toxin [Bdellovibrionales bacterium]|nr:type II toxin-antitoxin system PemK/MazF family toxin [Bdellovibrionales bacterium]